MALAREELGAVQAAGFDADEDAAGGGDGDGDRFEAEDVGAAGGVYDGCAHGFGHGGGDCCLVVWCEGRGLYIIAPPFNLVPWVGEVNECGLHAW